MIEYKVIFDENAKGYVLKYNSVDKCDVLSDSPILLTHSFEDPGSSMEDAKVGLVTSSKLALHVAKKMLIDNFKHSVMFESITEAEIDESCYENGIIYLMVKASEK